MGVLQRLIVRDLTDLLDAVCREHHVTREEICGRERSRAISRARHDLWFRLRSHGSLSFSYVEIARLFGRNHTTVLHGVRSFLGHAGGSVRTTEP